MSNDNFTGVAVDQDECEYSFTPTLVDGVALICDPGSDPWYESGRGLLSNEVPFRPDVNLRQPESLEERLGLKPAREGVGAARIALIANLIYANARSADTWIFYSRDRNHYAELVRRYSPSYYTFANMMVAVGRLEEAGLIEHEKTAPSPNAICRSRIRANAALLKLLGDLSPDLVITPREEIILRDATKRHRDYSDTERICAMRKDVIAHNELLACADIRVDHPSARYDEGGFLWVQGRWLDPRRRAYYRVFNRHWNQGGRWYGPFWQSLPSDVRTGLRMNGEAVVELDYRACHLRLLCASSGIELPCHEEDYDPFKVPGIARRKLKLAFNIMLNADSEVSARRAIVRELVTEALARPYDEAALLMEDVKSCFPGFERFWCSGVGLRLQNIDADICARVQRRLRRQDIPALSIHDSFIVPVPTRAVLQAGMDEEMARACRRLTSKRTDRRQVETEVILPGISAYYNNNV